MAASLMANFVRSGAERHFVAGESRIVSGVHHPADCVLRAGRLA
jgi:hypothetical protein